MSEEKKNKTIAASVTTAVMIALLLMMLFCGLSYQNPPPPAKKAILIELSTMGGGGGGGNEAPSQQKRTRGSAENIVTQNSEDAPTIPRGDKKTTTNKPTVVEPKPDQNSMYRAGRGGGNGGGTGTGSGSGTGSGIGPGEGSGSGGGIGYGTGTRGYTYMPDLTVNEAGTVYVEVHISADGKVVDARVINNSKYPTTITNSRIQADCVAKAKTAKYKPGKEELRIIVFK
jgi:hypothetical protein